MAKITVTEYETIEKNIDKFECDECNAIVDESDINTVQIHEGDLANHKRIDHVEKKHLCEDCSGLGRVLSVREDKEKMKTRWEGFRGHFDYVLMAGFFLSGFGMATGILIFMGFISTHAATGVIWASDGFVAFFFLGLSTFIFLLGCVFVLPEPEPDQSKTD